jgi:hypothetical protein
VTANVHKPTRNPNGTRSPGDHPIRMPQVCTNALIDCPHVRCRRGIVAVSTCVFVSAGFYALLGGIALRTRQAYDRPRARRAVLLYAALAAVGLIGLIVGLLLG